jgi:hypothetical protein
MRARTRRAQAGACVPQMSPQASTMVISLDALGSRRPECLFFYRMRSVMFRSKCAPRWRRQRCLLLSEQPPYPAGPGYTACWRWSRRPARRRWRSRCCATPAWAQAPRRFGTMYSTPPVRRRPVRLTYLYSLRAVLSPSPRGSVPSRRWLRPGGSADLGEEALGDVVGGDRGAGAHRIGSRHPIEERRSEIGRHPLGSLGSPRDPHHRAFPGDASGVPSGGDSGDELGCILVFGLPAMLAVNLLEILVSVLLSPRLGVRGWALRLNRRTGLENQLSGALRMATRRCPGWGSTQHWS